MGITFTINGNQAEADEGTTILEAAQENDIYIPRLCYHPSLGSSHGLKPVEAIFREDFARGNDSVGCPESPEEGLGSNTESPGTGITGRLCDDGSGPGDGFAGCRLCLVEIEGREGLITACDTMVEEGMAVSTDTEAVKEARRDNLAGILRDHPHACLQCAQQEGCSRTQCSSNVPEDERCCPLLGHCELQKIARYVGIRQDLVKYEFRDLPRHTSEPLFDRDYNLCISCLRCVRACRDLRGINTLGFVYREGKAVVGATRSSLYSESDCRFCGACVEVCPTGTLTDRDLPKGEREDVLVPCIANCPAGIDIPGYIRLIGEGKYAEAAGLIRERIPFPGILGRICFHPCEDVCRRGELNQPMAICNLKWFAADHEEEIMGIETTSGKEETMRMEKTRGAQAKEPTGKKVAIVGSGPSGLSAAYYLSLAGHAVTVFEAEEELGGMLRYAIPDYRLTPLALDNELRIYQGLNVNFITNTPIGKEVTLSRLRQDFHAVFLGTGACLSKRIPVDGSELDGVEWGLDFLKAVKTRNVTDLNGRVTVIGGGNVAMDVARSCMRLGASEVQLACLESHGEMPAHDWEIEEAKEEGIIMHPSWGPNRILGENGRVAGIELIKCTSVFDGHGTFAPVFDKEERLIIETDRVIFAVGQTSDLSCTEDVETEKGSIRIGDEQQASIQGIFAGGEAARGAASVVEAVADGARAASAIDRYLGGDGNVHPTMVEHEVPNPDIGVVEGFAGLDRAIVPKSDAGTRKHTFEMVERCFDEGQAQQEAVRCLQCDLRLQIKPVTLPPEMWLELTGENVDQVPAVEGVFRLLDENKMVIAIKGTQDLQADLKEKLNSDTNARYFEFEVDPMYTKRESELIQQFLQQFGKMPEGDGGDDDLDDLF